MPQNLAKIGVIGLGVMGSNFARNLASKGITTAVYNRTTAVTDEFLAEHGNEQIIGSETLEAFVTSIEKPRKIILLIQAGAAVDAVIESLTPLLDEGDSIIDFGNSHFNDTERRATQLKDKGIHFWGCGISGGEKGALHGPSLMPGGPKEVWPELQPILEAVAAKDFNGKPCVTYLGSGAAGNYVKMVHNGIEYAIMQMMAETYELMKDLLNMPTASIAQVFKEFETGKLNGYLAELGTKILSKKDGHSEDHLIDFIMDKAAQKGTGSWTSIEGLNRGVALSTITEAVFSRVISSHKVRRQNLEKLYRQRPDYENRDTDKFIDLVDDALYVGIICAFAQGLELIKVASDENNWNISLAEVTRIWQGGCIIRMMLLKQIEDSYRTKGDENLHLLEMPTIVSLIKGNISSLTEVVSTAARNSVPIPGLSSALNYFYAMTQGRGNANFIQALRDDFGAHTYERTDRDGTFHTDWDAVE